MVMSHEFKLDWYVDLITCAHSGHASDVRVNVCHRNESACDLTCLLHLIPTV